MIVKDEWIIDHDTAAAIAKLINEYLFQGVSDLDNENHRRVNNEKLAHAREALMWADRIVIEMEK